MANYSRIAHEDVPGGRRIIARTGRFAWIGPLVIMVLLLAFAGVVFNAIRVRPEADPLGPQIFGGFLLLGAGGVFLVCIQTYRGCLALLIQDGQAVVERTGLRTKRHVWRPVADTRYFVVVSTTETSDEKGRTTRSSSLDIIDEDFSRRRLVGDIGSRQAVNAMAIAIAESFDLPQPEFLDIRSGQTEEMVLREAHLRFQESQVDAALGEMKNAVIEMEHARDQLRSELDVAGGDPEASAALQELQDGIQQAKSEVLFAEFDISRQKCSNYTFAVCRPGDSVRYSRLEAGDESILARIASLPGTTGIAILAFMLTPFIIPLTGVLLVALLSCFPLSVPRVQAHYAIADLFALSGRVFLWSPVLTALYILWTWVKVDAAFAPFRVDFQWSRRQLVIDRRHGETQIIDFESILGLSAAVVHQSQTGVEGEWRHDAALFVEHGETRTAILELDHKTNSPDDHDAILERFEPLAMSLAHFLDVPLTRVGKRNEKFDAIGFPYAYRFLYPLRICRLASTRVRGFALAGLAIAGGLLLVLLWIRFDANRQDAENYIATRQDSDAAVDLKVIE